MYFYVINPKTLVIFIPTKCYKPISFSSATPCNIYILGYPSKSGHFISEEDKTILLVQMYLQLLCIIYVPLKVISIILRNTQDVNEASSISQRDGMRVEYIRVGCGVEDWVDLIPCQINMILSALQTKQSQPSQPAFHNQHKFKRDN